MASIRKSFSFRNGVQVDEDNFIVNANGLVGIGTSVPSEFLDVRGTAKVVGLTTTNDLFVSGVATATNIQVGTAISITGGGVKATNFFGNGATLSNLPTSQWEDINLGLGFTSIYAIGNVGIATTDPRQSFQVGGDPAAAGKIGVGINSIGNIRASGIITATSFVGALTGGVTGNVTGNVTGAVTGNVTGNITGNVDGNVNSTGLSTFTQLSVTGLVNVGTAATFNTAGLDVTGVTTSTSFVGALTGDVTGNVTGNLTGDVTGDVSSGITTATTELNVGTGGTAFTSLNTGKVGIGTAIPGSDVTIKKASNTSVEVISDSGVPNVSIGLTGETKNKGILRFNSEVNTFDIINNDTGDLNFILDGDNNSGSGNIKFIDNTTERARITNDGKLGIAITNPAHQLHVVGTSTVTGNAFIGGNLSVGGTISGALSLGNIIEGTNVLTTSGITTLNQLNVTTQIGFSSASPAVDIDFQQAVASFGSIGIGTTNPVAKLKIIGGALLDDVGFNTSSIKTDPGYNCGNIQFYNQRFGMYSSDMIFDSARDSQIGFGTVGDNFAGMIDMRLGGENHVSPWLYLPQMTTARRNTATGNSNLTGISTGAVIYNTTVNRVEIFLPGGASSPQTGDWVGIATVA